MHKIFKLFSEKLNCQESSTGEFQSNFIFSEIKFYQPKNLSEI